MRVADFLFKKIGIDAFQGTLGSRKNYSWRCPMNKLEMTPEQQLAFDGFIDVMVQRIRRRLEGFRQFHFWERNRLKKWANTAIMKTLGHNT
jgi:hypothetical protein